MYGHGPARYYRVPRYLGTMGFIAGVEHLLRRLQPAARDGRRRSEELPLLRVRGLMCWPLGRPASCGRHSGRIADKSHDRRAEALVNARAMSRDGG